MSRQTENLNPVQSSQGHEIEEVSTAAAADAARRAFVEPEVSFPVDVLDATTFFQFTDSFGATN